MTKPLPTCLITGGAGFIGSHLARKLIDVGWSVKILDNMSAGNYTNLDSDPHSGTSGANLHIINGDCTNPRHVREALTGAETVFHLAASPDVHPDRADPETCFRQNLLATHVLLEQMRQSEAKVILFASSSAVYGVAGSLPTPEDYSPLEPISYYGACKLASESLISAYCNAQSSRGIVLRMANVVGAHSHHGVTHDFIVKLLRNKRELEVLGDGSQEKSYLHIDDCVAAFLLLARHSQRRFDVFNIGSADQIRVREIAMVVANEMKISAPLLRFKRGNYDGAGWVGDVKNMLLDTHKLRNLGWHPRYNSEESIREAARSLLLEVNPQVQEIKI